MTASQNHSRPIVVFLGPSLSRSAARQIVDAEFFPPAQFGDVYGLLGSGVHTIVLIDGLFHGRAPVWQRELCHAMHSGIRVHGASSMGALRAAELRCFGMVGVGRVFDAYASDDIDGDDEVALMHAGPELEYRPLSEPLVNIRFNLRDAVAREIVDREHADALVAAMKAMPFWHRTLDALWDTPAFRAIDPPSRERLRQFYDDHAVDWKQRDAIQVLAQVAREQATPRPSSRPSITAALDDARLTSAYHDRFRLLKRRFPHDQRQMLDGQAMIDRVLSDPTQRRPLQWCCRARFFVRAWARASRVEIPAEERAAVEAVIRERAAVDSLTSWLRANRLTEAEYRELIDHHVLWTWLLEQAPERFGLCADARDETQLPAWPTAPHRAADVATSLCPRADLARALPYVAAWCEVMGAVPEPEATPALWALSRGPSYFGFATWSWSTELISLLQITGTIARLTASGDASTTAS